MKEKQKKAMIEIIERIKSGKLVIGDKGRLYRREKDGSLTLADMSNNYGYLQIYLWIDGGYTPVLSHRVIYAFYYGIDSLKDGFQIHHVDHDKENNHFTNLVQISPYENSVLSDGRLKKEMEQVATLTPKLKENYKLKCNINKLMKERGYFKKFVAGYIDVSLRQLNNYEYNNTLIPMDKAHKLADLFGIRVDDLYERVE